MDSMPTYLLGQIVQHAETMAEEQARTRREIVKVRREISDLAQWIKRIAILAALYGGGIVILLNSEDKAEALVNLLKLMRG